MLSRSRDYGTLIQEQKDRRLGLDRGETFAWKVTMRIRNALLALLIAAGPSLAAVPPLTPIVGAGKWMMVQDLPFIARPPCVARLEGSDINTSLMLNKDGKLILVGGHEDWSMGTGEVHFQLRIDDDPPRVMQASLLNNIMLAPIFDEQLAARLARAKTLSWEASQARIRTDVTGIGIALDAVRACAARQRAAQAKQK